MSLPLSVLGASSAAPANQQAFGRGGCCVRVAVSFVPHVILILARDHLGSPYHAPLTMRDRAVLRSRTACRMTCTGNARRTGVFDLLGTTVSGWLSDRTNNRLLLFVYYGLRGLAAFYLPDGLAAEGTRLSIFAMFYGLGSVA